MLLFQKCCPFCLRLPPSVAPHQIVVIVVRVLTGFDGTTAWRVLWGVGSVLTLNEREAALISCSITFPAVRKPISTCGSHITENGLPDADDDQRSRWLRVWFSADGGAYTLLSPDADKVGFSLGVLPAQNLAQTHRAHG